MTVWICSLAVANRQESIPGKGICAKHQEASVACKCRNSLTPHSSPSGALEGSPVSLTLCPPGTWQSPQPPATGKGLSARPCCVQEELWCQIHPHFTLNPFKCVLESPFCRLPTLHASQTLPYWCCISALLWCQGCFFLQVIWFIYSSLRALLPAQKSDISLASTGRLKL